MLLSTANDRAVDVWVVRDARDRLASISSSIFMFYKPRKDCMLTPGMTHGKSLLLPSLVTVAQLFTTINHLVKDLQLWYIFKKSRLQVQLREKKRNCIHLILAQPITDLYIWERIQNSTHNCVAEGLLTLLFTTINHSVKDPGSYFFSSKNHLILMLTCCPSRTWTLLVFCQGWMS